MTGLFTLGRDAETRVTGSGTTVVQLAVAYNYGRKGDDGKKPSQWVRASMFGKQAEALIPYLTKGKQVSLVIRDLHIATFQKQDGSTGTSLEGVADFDDFARGQKQEGSTQAPAAAPRPAPPPKPAPPAGSGFDDMDDDIPFVTASAFYDMTTGKERRMARYDY
ncbi:MAG TPA: single-stranded DNA-binding protein [Acidovorax defluvii]|nr:single-stranded DNA-binding protein [Acidovorax sp.]HQS64824.1 single-stranded DNA-binding protein [Acidovorax defluvii]HQT19520.1 single-stranded DNA-binding protein [Acidovorax defluvii]